MDDQNVGQDASRNPTVDDLIILCRHLNDSGVRYLVVGGFAVIHYGYIRTTGDIDILIDTSQENIEKLKTALMYLPDQAIKDLSLSDVREYTVVRVADEIVIDLLDKAAGISYQEAEKDIEIDKVNQIPFVGIKTLIRMKGTYREHDASDKAYLENLLVQMNIKTKK